MPRAMDALSGDRNTLGSSSAAWTCRSRSKAKALDPVMTAVSDAVS